MFYLIPAWKSHQIVNTIGSVDDLIEKNEQFLSKFQKYISALYSDLSHKCDGCFELNRLVEKSGKTLKNNEWHDSKVLDLSTMPNGNIFINEFSSGENFSTNIKTLNNLDLVYGSIMPYFKKAGFALDVNYIAGTVLSFKPKKADDYLWILACISSEEFHSFTTANAQGTKMPIINWDTFISYKLPYDKKAIEKFNHKIKPLFEMAVIKMRQNRKLKIIKQNLLTQYF